MNVRFSRCSSNSLNNVPKLDGQVIYVKDTHDLYFDIGTTRTKATDIIFLATKQERESLKNPLQNKLYFVLGESTLYFYDGTNWVSITATSADKVSFDNTGTLLESTNVQTAIAELDTKIGDIGRILDNINGEVV